jgi:hypothetical protein
MELCGGLINPTSIEVTVQLTERHAENLPGRNVSVRIVFYAVAGANHIVSLWGCCFTDMEPIWRKTYDL